jgi:hypothetical protein
VGGAETEKPIYLEAMVFGNSMWTNDQRKFKQLTLSKLHQSIFEWSGNYHFNRSLAEGDMGIGSGCEPTWQSDGCDATCMNYS